MDSEDEGVMSAVAGAIPAEILAGLSAKRTKFVCALAAGRTGKQAALEAGYSVAGAKARASRLLADPRVQRAVDAIRQQGAAAAQYDLTRLVRTFEEDRSFARKTDSAMAAVRSTENIARLFGFLDHRIEVNVTHVDIAAALADAKARTGRWSELSAEDVEFVDVAAAVVRK